MNIADVNGRIRMLEAQRNAALDDAVRLAGVVADLSARLAEKEDVIAALTPKTEAIA